MVQDLPRLSTRSRLSLFGEETKKLEEHIHIRRTAYAEHCSKGTQLDFSIDQFISKEVVSSSETKKIKDNFRFFVEQVGAIADGSSQQQDAARTMYNIVIRKKDSKDIAYSDAVSYFGKISQTKFDLIRTAALDLLQAKVYIHIYIYSYIHIYKKVMYVCTYTYRSQEVQQLFHIYACILVYLYIHMKTKFDLIRTAALDLLQVKVYINIRIYTYI
jgi:hypothetical protein